jgi:hypothetical protein
MTTFANFVLASAALLVSSGALSAQTTGTADIPFGFRVPGRSMPAGKYVVSTHTAVHGTALIRPVDKSQSVFVIAQSTLSPPYNAREDKSRLVFACGHGECALQEIWLGSEGQTVSVKTRHDGSERLAMITVSLPRE